MADVKRSGERSMHPVERVAFVVAVAAVVAGAIAWILTGWWGWGLIGGGVFVVAVCAAAATPSRDDDEAEVVEDPPDGRRPEGPGSGVAP